ncbi:MAG: four helix bundle protein [Acidobacteria bacterium]|nr:four helix bundle protein [Acidobacteriota bacterium]
MQDFRNLNVWRKAHELVLIIYRLTAHFPPEERFGLRSNLRRLATEIPSVIASGSAKRTDPEFARCLDSAIGFSAVLEYHALLARDLEMFREADYNYAYEQIVEVRKMIISLAKRIG